MLHHSDRPGHTSPQRGSLPGAVKGLAAVAVAGLIGAACSGEPPGDDENPSQQPVPAETVIPMAQVVVGDSAVGCLEIGAPLDRVMGACQGVTDTTLYVEGRPQEAIRVEVGRGSVIAEVVDGEIWRITVSDPGLSTTDSISVGTPLRRLAGHPGIRIVHGEGTFARTDAHCGKSFQVEGLRFRPQGWSASELQVLPDTIRISRILVLGRCVRH